MQVNCAEDAIVLYTAIIVGSWIYRNQAQKVKNVFLHFIITTTLDIIN